MTVIIESLEYPQTVGQGGYAQIKANLYNPGSYKLMEVWLNVGGVEMEKQTLGFAENMRVAVEFSPVGPLNESISGSVETNQTVGEPSSYTYPFEIFVVGAIQYELSIIVADGGTTSPASGTYVYDEGNVVTVTAYPDEGYYLDYWELDGVNMGSPNPIYVTMDTNHQLKCVFTTVEPPPPPPEKPWWADLFPRLYEFWLRHRGMI